MKEFLIRDFRESVVKQTGAELADIVIDALIFSLKEYDVIKAERSIEKKENVDIDIIQKYFVAKSVEGLSKKSLIAYKDVLSLFFRSAQKGIKDITTDDVRLYLTFKKMNGASDSYLNFLRRSLNSFFSWCFSEDILEKNPVSRIKGIREVKKIKKALSEEEIEILRHGAKTRRNKAIIEFLYSTGCRVSEMLNLNRQDVDFITGEVIVLGKGKKYRTVYLSARCKIILKEYLDSRIDKLEALFISDWEGFIGEKKEARRMSVSGVEIMLRELGKRMNISNVHPHRFRRSVATNALERGMPIEQVQRMLGHSNIQTTTLYARSDDDALKLSHKKYVI